MTSHLHSPLDSWRDPFLVETIRLPLRYTQLLEIECQSFVKIHNVSMDRVGASRWFRPRWAATFGTDWKEKGIKDVRQFDTGSLRWPIVGPLRSGDQGSKNTSKTVTTHHRSVFHYYNVCVVLVCKFKLSVCFLSVTSVAIPWLWFYIYATNVSASPFACAHFVFRKTIGGGNNREGDTLHVNAFYLRPAIPPNKLSVNVFFVALNSHINTSVGCAQNGQHLWKNFEQIPS